MEPNLTAHYLGIATDRARLSRQAERGWLIEQAIATQPKQTGTLAVRGPLGLVLQAVVSRRPFAVRKLVTYVHSSLLSARS